MVKYTHPCVPKATLSVSTVVNYTHLGCGKIYTGSAQGVSEGVQVCA